MFEIRVNGGLICRVAAADRRVLAAMLSWGGARTIEGHFEPEALDLSITGELLDPTWVAGPLIPKLSIGDRVTIEIVGGPRAKDASQDLPGENREGSGHGAVASASNEQAIG